MEKYKFQSKSENGLLEKALEELNVKEDEVLTKTYEEKGGLFTSKNKFLPQIVAHQQCCWQELLFLQRYRR